MKPKPSNKKCKATQPSAPAHDQSLDSQFTDIFGKKIPRLIQFGRSANNAEPRNAVFEAFSSGLRRLRHLVKDSGQPASQESMEVLFPDLANTERKLGRLLLDAIVAGNKEFPDTVRQAIKRGDSVFNRTKGTALLGDFVRFFWANRYKEGMTIGKLRRSYEEKIGRELEPRQWRELRNACGVALLMPEGKAGRPATRKKRKAAKPEKQDDGLV